MPIDVNKVLDYEFKTIDFDWDADKVILYHLGVGAKEGGGRAPGTLRPPIYRARERTIQLVLPRAGALTLTPNLNPNLTPNPSPNPDSNPNP